MMRRVALFSALLSYLIVRVDGQKGGRGLSALLAETGLHFFTNAWKTYNGDKKKVSPEIQVDIREPDIGRKVVPAGMHPQKYLKELPELNHVVLADAKITYMDQMGMEISITCESDWFAFFTFLETTGEGGKPLLRARFQTEYKEQVTFVSKMWQQTQRLSGQVSERLRSFGKSIMSQQVVEIQDLEKEQSFLESKGFSEFDGKGMVFEELGYSKEDWPELIDTLVENGIPEVWGKQLKIAAKATRGSVKSLVTNSYKAGVRTMNYMKFQVLPDGEGGVDGLFSIYQLQARSQHEDTGIRTEQSFKRFVEMDAHQAWKKEVKQFMPANDSGKNSAEL